MVLCFTKHSDWPPNASLGFVSISWASCLLLPTKCGYSLQMRWAYCVTFRCQTFSRCCALKIIFKISWFFAELSRKWKGERFFMPRGIWPRKFRGGRDVPATDKSRLMINGRWRSSIVVRTLVSTGELSLSCARLLAGWVTTLLTIGQPTWPTQPSIPQGSVNE